MPAELRISVPLDREAARRRLNAKRARNTAVRISAQIRGAASIETRRDLSALLNAIADDMDDYIDTEAQVSGTDRDCPVWWAARVVARRVLSGVSE